jgi:hypothetical protein
MYRARRAEKSRWSGSGQKKNSFLELPMGCIVRGYRELKRTLRINSRAHSVKPDSRILVAVPRGIARKAASVGGSRTRGN